jgi:alpha-ketoglutarate-dependent taurine dioxygenase/aryl carrier-like protein
LANIWQQTLGAERIGVHDNFFEVGGDSLHCIQIIAKSREAGLYITTNQLFEHPTIAELAAIADTGPAQSEQETESRSVAALNPGRAPSFASGAVTPADFPEAELSQEELDKIFACVHITEEHGHESNDVEDIYRLSPMQQGMLFQVLAQEQPGMYFEQGVCTLRGKLNVPVFEQAWRQVLARHAALRTSFVWEGLNNPVQVVRHTAELPVEHLDWRERNHGDQKTGLQLYLETNRRRGVDLTLPPLMRLTFIRVEDETYECIWGIHHLIHDAWSTFIILKEVLTIYKALAEQQSLSLPPARPFRDYLAWLKRQDLTNAEIYWRQMLAGLSTPTPLPHISNSDDYRAAERAYEQQETCMSVADTSALNSFARQHHLTLGTVAVGAWALLLGRYCNSEDVVFGLVVSGRAPGLAGVESIIGPLFNTLPLRVRLPAANSLLTWLQELQLQQMKLREFEHVPLRLIQNWSHLPASAPLFESVLIFQNAFGDLTTEESGPVKIQNVRSIGHSNFPLSLRITPRPELWLEALFDARRIQPDDINKLLAAYKKLLARMVDQPQAPIGVLINPHAKSEERQIGNARNETRKLPGGKLSSFKPQPIRLSAEELVKKTYLHPDQTLPLVVEPNEHKVDLIEWARNNREFIESSLLRGGGVLFRNFSLGSLTAFEQFVKVFSAELLEYRERSTPRTRLQGNVYTSTEYPADQEIALHNEFSYAYTWPSKIFFYCSQAPEQGGETPIADGRKVYQLLDPIIRQRFIEKKVMYVRNYGTGIDLTWEEAFQTSNKSLVEEYCRKAPMEFEWGEHNRLRTRQVRPAVTRHPKTGELVWFNQAHLFHVTNLAPAVRESMLGVFQENELSRNAYYGDGSSIEPYALEEIREAYRQAATVFSWRNGDVLLLDNVLVAHGRRSFRGARQIAVAMTEPFTTREIVKGS